MTKHTLLQYPLSTQVAVPEEPAQTSRRATACDICGQGFSPDKFEGQTRVSATDSDPSKNPLIGTVVENRYQLERVIGSCRMGLVYAVRHKALGKRFALKVLHSDLSAEPEVATRFIQDARMAASVGHPGLVEITDFGRLPSGQPYFVMELLGGETLSQLLRREGPLPVKRAAELTRQIAEALYAAHEKSVVHRDLKPDNIYVGPSDGSRERIKLLDVGLASASRCTKTGIAFGTPHYMSPEQASGEAPDHRSDIYSLGVVMYEMFTGRVPFEADSCTDIVRQHMNASPIPPSRLRPYAQSLGGIERVMLRCLEKKPANRYPTLEEFLDELGRLGRHDLRHAGQGELDALRFAGIPRKRLWPKLLAVVALLLPLPGITFAAYSKYEASAAVAAQVAASAAPDVAVTSLNPKPSSLPTPATVPEVPAAGGASAPSSETTQRAQSPHAITVSRGHPESPVKPVSTHRAANRLGSSEIVDPWGR